MSSFFGILKLDGQPVERDHLEAMRSALPNQHAVVSSIWCEANIGLGHFPLSSTLESRAEALPLKDSASAVVLTAQARVDNRDQLVSDLGLQDADLRSVTAQSAIRKPHFAIPDSLLILNAYLRWGEDCVHRLTGDWAFALWDPRVCKLFLARDHHGISALYYHVHPRFIAFASCIKGLLALPAIPQHPNLLYVTQAVTAWSGDGIQTSYKGISSLPPAHTMTVTPDGHRLSRYWSIENIASLSLTSDAEYLEAFLDVYGEAVRCRLQGGRPVGATLSSGLDSSSVCALAARELRARGERLTAITSVPLYNTTRTTPRLRYGDESPLVEINRQFISNLDVQYVRAENVTPLAGIERTLDVHDDPSPSAGNAFWIVAMLQMAQTRGLGVLLTGQFGNSTVSWPGRAENLWHLILSGHWRTFWRRAYGRDASLWLMIKREILRPIVAPMRAWTDRHRYSSCEPWLAYSAINANYARSLYLGQQMADSGHDPSFASPSDPVQARLQMLQKHTLSLGTIWAVSSEAFGLAVLDPTMDKRVIEFCLAIPVEQYRTEGHERALIRRAMKGLLPDAVRLNTRRGLQAADLGYRLLATLPEVQGTLARLEQSPLAREVLDLPKMQRVLHDLQKQVNPTTTSQCVTILTRGMMAGLFLLRFD